MSSVSMSAYSELLNWDPCAREAETSCSVCCDEPVISESLIQIGADGCLLIEASFWKQELEDGQVQALAALLLRALRSCSQEPDSQRKLLLLWDQFYWIAQRLDAAQLLIMITFFRGQAHSDDDVLCNKALCCLEQWSKVRETSTCGEVYAEARLLLDHLVESVKSADEMGSMDSVELTQRFHSQWRRWLYDKFAWVVKCAHRALRDVLKESGDQLRAINVNYELDGRMLHCTAEDFLGTVIGTEVQSEELSKQGLDQVLRGRTLDVLEGLEWIPWMRSNQIKAEFQLALAELSPGGAQGERYNRIRKVKDINEAVYYETLHHVDLKFLDELESTDTVYLELIRHQGALIRRRNHAILLKKKLRQITRAERGADSQAYLRHMIAVADRAEAAARDGFAKAVQTLAASKNASDVEYRLTMLNDLLATGSRGPRSDRKWIRDTESRRVVRQAIRTVKRFRRSLRTDAMYHSRNDFTLEAKRPSRSARVLGRWIGLGRHPGAGLS